jgi:xanthine dehydrogenase YagR molybdenum-binding subunit
MQAQPTTAPDQKSPANAPTGAPGGQPVPRAAQAQEGGGNQQRRNRGQEDNRPKHDVTFTVGIPGVKLEDVQRSIAVEEPPPLPINEKLNSIGKPTPRIDGRQKVTGAAKYTADIKLPGMLYARMLTSPHPSAVITSIDTSEAERHPGVKAVHVLERDRTMAQTKEDQEARYPRIRYVGQPFAAIAATTQAAADEAAALVKVEYKLMPWVVDVNKARQPDAPLVFTGQATQAGSAGGGGGARNVEQKGNVRGPARNQNAASKEDLDKAFAESDVIVESEFQTQVQTHSALETHGVVVDYKPDQITCYASTQGTLSVRDELAGVFDMKRSQIRVITEFMGGGFGAKFGAGNWGVLAAHLSKKAGAPVRLMCDRREEHTCTGNRPNSFQKIKLGAKKDGTIQAIQYQNYGTAGTGSGAGAGRPTAALYPSPLLLSEEYDVFTHAGPAAAFRAPGHPQGAFSIEQVIDELAEKLKMDPLALRDKIDQHEARRVERKMGAERFAWSNRHAPGADPGPIKRGIGVAQGLWGRGSSRDASAEVRITRDGSVEVLSAVQDIGGGIRTAMAQVVAEELGLMPSDISVRIGDTNYPPGANSGGSVTTNSMTPPTRNAAYKAKQELLKAFAASSNMDSPEGLTLRDGGVFKGEEKLATFKSAASKIAGEHISGTATRGPDYTNGPGMGGVQFAAVAVDTETGIIKVERVLVLQDCGRPINPLGIESQINGGVIQGMSYALYENRILDRQTGIMVNPNLEQYKIAGSREMPKIETVLLETYQGRSSTDAAGIGEPATVPTAAAIANAVYNAIGVRIRQIPMTPAVVLAALAEKAGAGTARARS